MMRHETEKEKELWAEYESKNCSPERKKQIIQELNEIDKKERGPFD